MRADLVRAGAMLHDVADAVIERKNPGHEAESLRLARELLAASGYGEEEIKIVVDDGLRYHSCRGDERPRTREGEALAAADALGHLKSDFYVYACWAMGRSRSLEDMKRWALEKVERDYAVKLSFFTEAQRETEHDYLLLKELFLR